MSSSVDRGMWIPSSLASRKQFQKRIKSLQQENGVLKMELDTLRIEVKNLQEENEALRQASEDIYAKIEQEEEFMYNILLKQIQTLKKEKETLALNYERAESLIKDLLRKLNLQAMTVQEEEYMSSILRLHFTQTLARYYDKERKIKKSRLLNRHAKAEQEGEFVYNNILREQKCLIYDLFFKPNQPVKTEQEEECISSTLLKQIQTLKIEKETLPLSYERERKLTRWRKLNQIRRRKVQLQIKEQEQTALVNKPKRKIGKLRQFFRKIFQK